MLILYVDCEDDGSFLNSPFVVYFISVAAINNLYGALGTPPLIGWVQAGGDPCTEGWQGVQCVNANITAMYASHL